MKIPFKWEKIDNYHYRAKVMGGWIFQCGDSFLFIPDPNHEWEIE